jgi:hypothetical protein
MDELRRFKTTTQDYPALQGLRQVPLALFIIGVMLQRLGLLGLGRSINLTFAFPLLFAMALLWYGIGKYYERTFGFVEPKTEKWRKALTGLILVLVYAGFFVMETNSVNGVRPFPVSLSGIFIGVLYAGLGRNSRRPYYVAFGLILIGESLLPLPLGRPLTDPWFGTLGALFGLTFGIGLLIVSLVDHIRLTHAFRHPAE